MWAAIVAIGTVLATVGYKPVDAIIFAQAANGILLPVVAVFLIVVVNRKKLLGVYANRTPTNLLGIAVVLVAAGLGVFRLIEALR